MNDLKDFLLGKTFHVHTYHKPLISLLSHKRLDELTVFSYKTYAIQLYHFSHVPGKNFTIADTLSRAPVSGYTPEDRELEDETNAFVQCVLQDL